MLSNLDKGNILALNHDMWSKAAVTREMGISKSVVTNFLVDHNSYGLKKMSAKN